jgi:hypothetical protein
LIPESAEQRKGKVAIEFAISKDGKVANMHLAVSSGDAALDRIAWMSITDSDSAVDVKAGSWKIVIDGVELQDSDFIFGNGPMPMGGWTTLQAGQYYELGKALPISKYFPREGEHKVSWKGDRFRSSTITIKISNNP